MVNTELYIIVNGERKKLDLPSPSGITLNFVSNLFNDLSKINASYSYTFKLPRTANNVRVLELADDVRADGKFTKVKNEAEFVYDGVSLFANANMYISGVENDTISAVLTWNVNKGLQELSKHDMSLNGLGNHLPEGEYDYVGDEASDYEKDKVVLVGGSFTQANSYDPTQPYFKSVHSGGYDWLHSNYGYYVESNADVLLRNKSMLIDLDEEIPPECHINYQGGNTFKYRMTYAYPAPIVPVPYLINIISKIYNLTFDFAGDLYNSLCVPLVANKMSDAMARLNYVSITFDGYSAFGILMPHARIVNQYPEINPVSAISYQSVNFSPIIINNALTVIDYNWADMQHCEFKYRIEGQLTIIAPKNSDLVYDDKNAPRILLSGLTYKQNTLRDLGELKPVRITNYFDGGVLYDRLEFNFNPKDGCAYFESEVAYRTGIVLSLVYGENGDGFYGSVRSFLGSFKVYGVITNYAFDCHVNLFNNLPDISCLDFVKSICYALGGYPYQDADGVIRIQKYSQIISRINQGETDDYSNKIINAASSLNAENVIFNPNDSTGLNLAKKNYFLMKNDEVDDFGLEKKNDKNEDAYAHGYACVKVDNDLLEEHQTLFTFPFFGGFLWQKDYYYYARNRQYGGSYPLNFAQTGKGQDMWRIANLSATSWLHARYTCGEAKPMLGIITEPVRLYDYEDVTTEEEQQDGTVIYVSHREKTGTYADYLNIDIWNCVKNMDIQILRDMLGNSCVVKEDMSLNAIDLATLDIEKPVYLEKYNSFFAIKKIEVSPEGVSKVELIRIPSEILNESVPNSETEE